MPLWNAIEKIWLGCQDKSIFSDRLPLDSGHGYSLVMLLATSILGVDRGPRSVT